MVVCNHEHLPSGYFGAYDNHTRSSKVIGKQIEKKQAFYDSLWKKIVISKIQNQSLAYLELKNDKQGTGKIHDFVNEVIDGDPSNREGHAAKVYFNLLMGSSFSRGNEDILLNSGLDYGYSIIRSFLARVCVGYGLNTQIGIHHKSEYNRFNLVDDLFEPFRPFVDLVAYRVMESDEYFTPRHRKSLVNILNMKVKYRNKNMYLSNALENYVEQYAAVVMDRAKQIVFPEIENFCCEGLDEI